MDRPRNPFILGHRINRPYFCDRITEQKNLVSAIINGRNVVLISPRRMGKTSLIHMALQESEEIEKDYTAFFFDILQTNTLGEFTYLLGKAVFETLLNKNATRLRSFLTALKSLKGTFGFDPVSGSPTFDIQLGDIRHPEYTLKEIFDYIEHSERPVIIVIDEFQQITKYPEKNTEAILRNYMQHMSNVSFIFAGSEYSILQEMFVSAKRPFYNSSEIMHLGPIEEDIYVTFAQRLFSEWGKSITDSPIRWAYQLFDGNTFYLQRTMNGAFADTSKGDICDNETVIRAVQAMLASNEVIYREILSNISINQKSILYAVAEERTVTNPMSGQFIKKHALPSSSSVQSALIRLTRAGLISQSAAGYHLSDPLLRIFINSLYSTPEF